MAKRAHKGKKLARSCDSKRNLPEAPRVSLIWRGNDQPVQWARTLDTETAAGVLLCATESTLDPNLPM